MSRNRHHADGEQKSQPYTSNRIRPEDQAGSNQRVSDRETTVSTHSTGLASTDDGGALDVVYVFVLHTSLAVHSTSDPLDPLPSVLPDWRCWVCD